MLTQRLGKIMIFKPKNEFLKFKILQFLKKSSTIKFKSNQNIFFKKKSLNFDTPTSLDDDRSRRNGKIRVKPKMVCFNTQ